MLTDKQICNYLQSQYDGIVGVFEQQQNTFGVDWAVKHFDDCTLLAFEGSHNIPDWLSNFKAFMRKVTIGNADVGVESGFDDGMIETLDVATGFIPKDKPLYVAGHSRGAGHAQNATARLIAMGFQTNTCVFGLPHPGDEGLANLLRAAPNRSYRNYHDRRNQDFVTTVPFDIAIIAPYFTPYGDIDVDEAPATGDSWGWLAWHHLFLYNRALGV